MPKNTDSTHDGAANRGASYLPPWTWKERRFEPHSLAKDIQLKPLNQVEAKPFVWEGDARVPRGAVTIIAGEHGTGKSLLAIDWAARISRGEPWSTACAGERAAKPKQNGSAAKNCGDAVIAHAGDTTVELLRLRTDAAGAVPERIASLALEWPQKAQQFTFDTITARVFGLTSAIRGTSNMRLLVIDSLEAWAGNLEATPCTALVNYLLARLGELAALADVAIVVLSRLPHSGGQAAARKLDALADAAPVVYLAANDAERPGRKLLLPVKNTLAPPAPARAFDVVDGRVAWSEDPVEASADELIAPATRRHEARHEREFAARWLLAALADGPVASRELFRQARDCGISTKTLRRAAQSLGLSPRKTSFDGPWQWQLGETALNGNDAQPAKRNGAPERKQNGDPGPSVSGAAGEIAAPCRPETDASGSPREVAGSQNNRRQDGQPRAKQNGRHGRFSLNGA